MTMEAPQPPAAEQRAKEAKLKELLASYGSLVVAYSGGVDSTYLAAVAHEALGDDAHLVLADSESLPRSEKQEAVDLAERRGWRLAVIPTNEFDDPDYLKNDGSRCYVCCGERFDVMLEYAKEGGVAYIANGAIVDDLGDETRVGAKAAEERGVVAPLQEAGLSKEDIRALSYERGLATWDKASFACLGSRVPTGVPIDVESMRKVEQAEEGLRKLGLQQYRARHHGDIVRIEVDPEDLPRLVEPGMRRKVIVAAKLAGYRYVALDLEGYRTGSTAGAGEAAEATSPR
jgi:uncharacterized protein